MTRHRETAMIFSIPRFPRFTDPIKMAAYVNWTGDEDGAEFGGVQGWRQEGLFLGHSPKLKRQFWTFLREASILELRMRLDHAMT